MDVELLQADIKTRALAYLNHAASIDWEKPGTLDLETKAALLESFEETPKDMEIFDSYCTLDKKIRLFLPFVHSLQLMYLYHYSNKKYYQDIKLLLCEIPKNSKVLKKFPHGKKLEKSIKEFSESTQRALIELKTAVIEFRNYVKAKKVSIKAHNAYIRELSSVLDKEEKEKFKKTIPDPNYAKSIREFYL